MRLRNNPKAFDELHKYPETIVFKPQEYKGLWNKYFENKGCGNKPIKVELGMGRGKFLMRNATDCHDTNFIGIDIRNELLLDTVEKVAKHSLVNIALTNHNILNIEDIFEVGEVDTFFINFCDPWPKVRHAKRRLTHRLFLEKYKKILKPGGEIIFKTDGKDLFDFSLVEFEECGFEILDVTYDLHSLEDPDNILTEYEGRFNRKGVPICRAKIRNRG